MNRRDLLKFLPACLIPAAWRQAPVAPPDVELDRSPLTPEEAAWYKHLAGPLMCLQYKPSQVLLPDGTLSKFVTRRLYHPWVSAAHGEPMAGVDPNILLLVVEEKKQWHDLAWIVDAVNARAEQLAVRPTTTFVRKPDGTIAWAHSSGAPVA